MGVTSACGAMPLSWEKPKDEDKVLKRNQGAMDKRCLRWVRKGRDVREG